MAEGDRPVELKRRRLQDQIMEVLGRVVMLTQRESEREARLAKLETRLAALESWAEGASPEAAERRLQERLEVIEEARRVEFDLSGHLKLLQERVADLEKWVISQGAIPEARGWTMRAVTEPRWTEAKPTEPGYYWTIWGAGEPVPVELLDIQTGLLLVFFGQPQSVAMSEINFRTRWYGPLKAPE